MSHIASLLPSSNVVLDTPAADKKAVFEHAAGLLEGKTATTYPTSKALLEEMGVGVVEKPFVEDGNVATAGGCLAQQYLVGWVIEKLADKDWRDLVLKSIQPVGEGLFFDDIERLQKLYTPIVNKAAV